MQQIGSDACSALGHEPAPPCTLVIFGASGDLTKRLLMPALYNLSCGKLLNEELRILGIDHVPRTDQDWRDQLTETMRSFTKDQSGEFHADHIDEEAWGWITRRLGYITGDFEKPETYRELGRRLDADGHGQGRGSAVFYLAIAARFFGPVVDQLGAAGLLREGDNAFRRVVIEKPFGADLPSAQALNARILKVMTERQIYRIDHFLGKETVQNILAMRFANGIFEPIWRREYIDHVQITAAETIGVEARGSFYEATGALRDMVPNHLFQLLSMVAMEPPNSFEAEAVRTEKAKLIEAAHPLRPEEVVRGQYAAGEVLGKRVAGYRQEPKVAPDSRTATYVAAKLMIDNWRWAGVPFYLRTGKRLRARCTEIAVHFKPAPYRLFRGTPVDRLTPNILTLEIDPHHGVVTQFSAKVPGPVMRLDRVETSFHYRDFFEERPNVGYETLLYDCMIGDGMLFQRADNIEAGWAVVQPALDDWHASKDAPEPYAAGSDGPSGADLLLRRDGRQWLPLDE
ncbi:MAG TPA: glucose-6-phosphate dehydrogenase [Alphaproteobacteria bacterium]|nr:glucose-6-phosphate dehydrogenase [Alphaproteobacteria bacterium]